MVTAQAALVPSPDGREMWMIIIFPCAMDEDEALKAATEAVRNTVLSGPIECTYKGLSSHNTTFMCVAFN